MSTLKYLQLEEELEPYQQIMAQASESIIDQEVSRYPIFVVHQHEVEIGIPITEQVEIGNWNIHASSLEEFVSKQIIQEDKVDDFREVYKDPQRFFCLFVLSELGANFIFLPRNIKTTS